VNAPTPEPRNGESTDVSAWTAARNRRRTSPKRMPVILGGGKTIFPDDGVQRPVELVSTVTSGTGVHVCTYRPVADG